MKQPMWILSLVLLIICLSLYAEILPDHGIDKNCLQVNPYSGLFSCKESSPLDIQLPGFSLRADSGSLQHGVDIQVSMLPYKSGMRMHSNMENVCLLSDGVRLLPHGEHFSDSAPALITLAYDPARIPMGYTPKDIYTYYTDDSTHWYRLERAAVDTLAHTILSYTTHFTDFANAVIKVPEMPESKAFVPTDMQNLPDPDPLTGIPMVAVPAANNMGTAELSYPILLPPGRHGLQPDVDLHYSSASGNGLLGVGWSIVQPAVTIDTRWGVPRYDLSYETEAYLINGEPFLMHDNADMPIPLPYMVSSFVPRRARATRFYARDQCNQSKAVRHGQTPDKYWWSVTTTDGITYYYGYDPYTQAIDENSILRTKEGYIGYWALTYVIDRYDNYMRYVNHKYNDNDLVIQYIEYTGNRAQHLHPYYRVGFTYTGRLDWSFDARLGLLRNQKHLLCQAYIQMNDSTIPITTYRLYYERGAFSLYKSRLKSIAKVDGGISYLQECGEPIQNTQLELSDEHWIDEEDVMYREITRENISEEQKPGSLTQFSYGDAFSSTSLFGTPQTLVPSTTNFSSSRTEGWNVGGTVTVGVGYNSAMTTFSAGANYSYSRSNGGVEAMMIDLNGDGLLDRLQVSGDSVLYHRHQNNGTFAAPVTIQGLDRLSREVSSSHTFGLQLDFFANLSYNPVISNSYTDIYFTDINGDGLPDLITPEGVRINLLDANNIPTFTPISDAVQGIEVYGNNCSKSITFDGQVDDSLMCQLNYVCIDTLLLSDLQPADDGEDEFIEYPMHPDEPEPEEPGNLEPHGWVPLPIEEMKGTMDTDAKKDSIAQLFYTETKAEPIVHAAEKPLTAKLESLPNWAEILSGYYHGDKYSFRLIHDTIFVFRKEFSCTQSSDEPNVDIVRVWVSDRDDTLRLTSNAFLIADTSFTRTQARQADGVRLRIQWNKNVHRQGDRLVADSLIMLYDNTIEADDYNPKTASYNLSIKTGDILFFRLSAQNNRRFDNVDWEQTILSLSGDTLFNSARNYLCTGDQSFTAPATGTARITLACSNEDANPTLVTAKLDDAQILSRTLPAHSSLDTVFDIIVADSSRISFYADSLSSEPLWSKVHIIPTVDYWGGLIVDTAGTGRILPDTLHYFPDVHLNHSSFCQSDTCLHRKLFGPLHKGWGWFAYNDIDRDSIFIPLHVLVNEEQLIADSVHANAHAYRTDNAYAVLQDSTLSNEERMAIADSCFSAVPIYDPLSDDKRWVAVHPDYYHNQYLACSNTGAIGQRLHSVSRQLQEVQDSSVVRGTIAEYDSPIPTIHGGMQRITTIRKSTHSVQHSLSFGLSTPIGIGVSKNISFGSYDVKSDYMDLNGDGFPDFVGESAIQYSQPWGGIGPLEGKLPASFSNSNTSAGLGFAASRPRPEHIPANGVKDSKMAFGGFGGGLNGQIGTDETHTSLIDVNADGLPDLLDADQQQVKYNLGYSFTDDWYPLAYLSIAASSHVDASISLSGNVNYKQIWDVIEKAGEISDYSLAEFSISGGFSTSTSQNHSDVRLIDINGDGYPDLLGENEEGDISVRYFDGIAFGTQDTLNAQNLQTSNTANLGFNLGVTVGIDIAPIPVKFCFGVQTSPWNVSSSYGNTEFMDVNGDGFVDQVIADDTLRVRYNRNGSLPVNLLTKVENPTGQMIFIDYQLSQPSVTHRMRTWNMNHVQDKIAPEFDASAVHVYDFDYENPFYDNFEKTDYGYANVSTYDNHMYIQSEEFENRHYITRGERIGDILYNENHEPIIGHCHKVFYEDIHGTQQADVCDDIYLHVGQDGYRTDYYERDSHPQITTQYNKFYDLHHNLVYYVDDGDIAVSGDEWIQTIGYKPTTSYNMISLPAYERVTGSGGSVLRQSRVNYNSHGKPFQIIQDDIYRNISAITALQYDAYGNISMLRNPQNENHDWAWRYFIYDNETETHAVKVYNPFMENHFYGYDLRFGLRNYSRDPAGNEMYWRYDRMGRLIDIVAPDEVYNNNPFTVHYIYRQPFHDFMDDHLSAFRYPHVTKVAASGDSLASVDVTIYDARGQIHQRKSWRNVDGHYEWVADGWRKRDGWYRPVNTWDPFVTNTSSFPLWEPDDNSYSSYVTLYGYDVLNRVTRCRHPDATENITTYGFADDTHLRKRLLAENTDENGVVRRTLSAPQGWTIETRNMMDNSTTRYEYNPLGELVEVFDADNHRTGYDYDMFGNKIYRSHPDAGKTYWQYAPNGSLIAVRTARMSGTGDFIHYSYCFDKLMDITYPRTPLDNVHYMYDAAGRMAYYEDGTGSTRLYYDRMGNVNMSLRRVVIPTESKVYTFRTRSGYDSFGRIRNIIYPDGDNVSYTYYPSGELYEVTRSPLSGPPSLIVTKMLYDEQGRNIYRDYGNSVKSAYKYEPLRNRLKNLATISPYCELQDLRYKYDGVGNVMHIEQLFSGCYGMGGPYLNEYKYDEQNRLTGVSTPSSSTFPYDFNANYSLAGRFGHGFCGNTSGVADENSRYGYDDHRLTHQPRVIFDYKNNRHTQLAWDANGNLALLWMCDDRFARFHDWNDENRLRMVVDDRQAGYYGYDANGERVYKLVGGSEIVHTGPELTDAFVRFDTVVLYPNPYVTITPGEYTKHYYAGNERLATVIGGGGWCYMSHDVISVPQTEHEVNLQKLWHEIYEGRYPFEYPHEPIPGLTSNVDIDNNALPELQYRCPIRHLQQLSIDYRPDMLLEAMYYFCEPHGGEDNIFYTHGDHLGSASWITDYRGMPIQYMHYLPYGQLLANQQATGYDERYKFTGKERDTETGYDYFEARYYASPLFHWTTVDPLVDNYLHISPYAYCAWNPVKFVDPDGRSTHTNEDGDVVAVYDDNDLNIYKHSNAKISSWGNVYDNHLTTNDAEIMGQSLHSMSFADQNKYNMTGEVIHDSHIRIDFGSYALGNEVMDALNSKPSLLTYARNAKSGGKWDYKSHYTSGSQIFSNIYLSPRDAGNFLAGAIKGRSGLLSPIVQFGYGAYNLSHNNIPITGLITLGTGILMYKSPLLGIAAAMLIMNGEDKLTQISINKGYQYVKK